MKLQTKETLIALAVASAVLLSFGAWVATQAPGGKNTQTVPLKAQFRASSQKVGQPIPREVVPAVAYDATSSEVVIPFVQDGELFLSRVKKPSAGATTTTEVSRKSVMKGNIDSWVSDMNPLTGEYLYQVTSTTGSPHYPSVTTWIGDSTGKITEMYHGAILSKLSPGGSHIAVIDYDGILHIISRSGSEIANYGPAAEAVFSPDGSRLAFFRGLIGGTDNIGGLTIVDLTSGREIATYNSPGKTYTEAYVPVAFSEDGNTLFFSTNAPMTTQSPSNPNRVDIYALSVSDGVVRLVTTGVQKLLYGEYASVRYASNPHLLVLSVENTVWTVDTQTGVVQTYPNATDVMQIDSGNMFMYHSTAKGSTNQSWNIFTAQ